MATAGLGVGMQSGRAIGHLELAKPLTHPDVEGRKELSAFCRRLIAFRHEHPVFRRRRWF